MDTLAIDTLAIDTLDLLHFADDRLLSHVFALDASDLGRPTPCTDWDVRALLSHTLATIDAFSAAIDGKPGPSGAELLSGADRVGAHPFDAARAAVTRAHSAWASVTNWEAPVSTVLGPMPAAQAVAIVVYSNLLHSWDLAVALGRRIEFDDAETQLAEAVGGRIVPALRSAGFFGPEVHLPAEATPTERVAAFSGRRRAGADARSGTR